MVISPKKQDVKKSVAPFGKKIDTGRKVSVLAEAYDLKMDRKPRPAGKSGAKIGDGGRGAEGGTRHSSRQLKGTEEKSGQLFGKRQRGEDLLQNTNQGGEKENESANAKHCRGRGGNGIGEGGHGREGGGCLRWK